MPLHLKIFLKDGRVLSYVGTKRSQVRVRAEAVPCQNVDKYYLRCVYGKAIDAFGQMSTFDNEGEWETKGELLKALKDFTERNLLADWI